MFMERRVTTKQTLPKELTLEQFLKDLPSYKDRLFVAQGFANPDPLRSASSWDEAFFSCLRREAPTGRRIAWSNGLNRGWDVAYKDLNGIAAWPEDRKKIRSVMDEAGAKALEAAQEAAKREKWDTGRGLGRAAVLNFSRDAALFAGLLFANGLGQLDEEASGKISAHIANMLPRMEAWAEGRGVFGDFRGQVLTYSKGDSYGR